MTATTVSNRQMVFRVTKRSPFDYMETPEIISFRNNNWQQAKVSVDRLSKAGYAALVKSEDKEVVVVTLKPAVDINGLRIAMAKSGQEFAKVTLERMDKMSESEKDAVRELVRRWKAN